MSILTIWVHDRFASDNTVNVIKPVKPYVFTNLSVTNIFSNLSKYFKY
jgi:hypothetical protein